MIGSGETRWDTQNPGWELTLCKKHTSPTFNWSGKWKGTSTFIWQIPIKQLLYAKHQDSSMNRQNCCLFQFSSVTQSCPTLCDSVDCSMPVHPCPSPTPRVYPNSCPLSQWCHPTISSSVSPSPPAFNLSQHQGLFQWVISSHQVAKVLEFQLQHQSLRVLYFTARRQAINIHRIQPIISRMIIAMKKKKRWWW